MNHGLKEADLAIIKSILQRNCKNIQSVSLFGSRATGTHRPNSDIDLIIYGDISEREEDRLYTCFFESLLPYKVDIKAYDHITYPPLKRHIDTYANPLFTAQELHPNTSP